MPVLEVYIDERAYERLAAIARIDNRDPDELATSAIEEAALAYFRGRDDDPTPSARVPGEEA